MAGMKGAFFNWVPFVAQYSFKEYSEALLHKKLQNNWETKRNFPIEPFE